MYQKCVARAEFVVLRIEPIAFLTLHAVAITVVVASEFVHLIKHDCEFFCTASNSLIKINSFFSTNIYLGLFWFKKLDVNFSRVFIRFKDTYR